MHAFVNKIAMGQKSLKTQHKKRRVYFAFCWLLHFRKMVEKRT